MMNTSEWDVIIAHLLGVDHCGHRFGPNHFEMGNKLKQVDTFLRDLISSLEDDTVFFAFGDHGMTESGDHGGDSEQELGSALFVYSNSVLSQDKNTVDTVVPQIDFTSTFSLLLGIPIPFSNIGSVIPSLFAAHVNKLSDHTVKWEKGQLLAQLEAILINAAQINDYLVTYGDVKSLPDSLIEQKNILSALIHNIESDTLSSMDLAQLHNIRDDFLECFQKIRKICCNIWATFDEGYLLDGIVGLVLVMVFVFCLICDDYFKFRYYFLVLVVMPVWQFSKLFISSYAMHCAFLICSCLIIYMLLWNRIAQVFASKFGYKIVYEILNSELFLGVLIPFLSFLCYFSNSFVVSEHYTSAFFFISIIVYLFICCKFGYEKAKKSSLPNYINNGLTPKDPNYVPITEKSDKSATERCRILLIVTIVVMVLLRISHQFWRCREEQYWCREQDGLLYWFDKGDKNYKSFMYLSTFLSLLLLVIFHRWWLRQCGNLNGDQLGVLVCRYVPSMVSACMCCHWLIQELPDAIASQLKPWQINSCGLLLYGASAVGIVLLFASPLCIYEVKGKVVDIGPVTSGEVFVRKIFNHMRFTWKEEEGFCSRPQQPIVYGLATVFSASISTMSLLVLLVVIFLMGSSLAVSCLLYWASLICTMIIGGLWSLHQYKTQEDFLKVRWLVVVLWSQVVSYYFYGTGHQTTFPAIPWKAAFVANSGNFSNYLAPITMITSNAFGTDIIGGISLPILLVFPLTLAVMYPSLCPQKLAGVCQQGEFLVQDNLGPGLYDLALKYYLLASIKLCGTMCAAALLRRHLMVWKIFAPRFIYELVRFAVTSITASFGLLIIVRTSRVLAGWVYKLEQNSRKES